jgi:hypothetical protein
MGTSINIRLSEAIPASIRPGTVHWHRLTSAVTSEDLTLLQDTMNDPITLAAATAAVDTGYTNNEELGAGVDVALTPKAGQMLGAEGGGAGGGGGGGASLINQNNTTASATATGLVTPLTATTLKSPRTAILGSHTTTIDINSGGRVIFCLFEPPGLTPSPHGNGGPTPLLPLPTFSPSSSPLAAAPDSFYHHHHHHHHQHEHIHLYRERCLVLKFVPSRLVAQSEQFANELAQHIGIGAPESRIVRASGPTSDEWKAVAAAAATLARSGCTVLQDEINQSRCMLVLEYVPGDHLLTTSTEAFAPHRLDQTLEDVGRLFALDMLLGNADRLPCEALGWRGNQGNVMYASSLGRMAGRLVAIDAAVSRRPPGGLRSAEDAACEKVTELALNDSAIARSLLCEAVGTEAAEAVRRRGDPAVYAFRRGLQAGLTATATIKGLLEMMFDVVGKWIDDFLQDIETTIATTPRPATGAGGLGVDGGNSGGGSGGGGRGGGVLGLASTTTDSTNINTNSNNGSGSGSGSGSGINSTVDAFGALQTSSMTSAPSVTTFKIRMITHEAQRNEWVGEKVAQWKTIFRERCEELRAAVEEWQIKRAASTLTTPITDGHAGLAATATTTTTSITASNALGDGDCVGGLSNDNDNNNSSSVKRRRNSHDLDTNGGNSTTISICSPLAETTTTTEEAKCLTPQTLENVIEDLPPLTTGFLDGTHPIVDLYELKVRLEHMLQRLRVLQAATATSRPVPLLPKLFLGDAVAANSLHMLKLLGISHVLNATEDLLPPGGEHGFEYHRCPLRDVEEEDLLPHIPGAVEFINKGLERGGGVLVHCHAGRSRSCSLLLAWLMQSHKWSLKKALEYLQTHRPEAAPNAGYMAALLMLEEQLHGKQTVKLKRTKPEPRVCPECGEKVGLSEQSLKVHLKLKHLHSALSAASSAASSVALGK